MFRVSDVLSRLSLSRPVAVQQPSLQDETPVAIKRMPKPGAYWSKRVAQHIKYHTNREAQENASLQLRTRDLVYMDTKQDSGCGGDTRLNKLNWWLNNLGVQRSPDQVLFHKHFTNACLPKIYGEKDWNQNSVRVMNMRKISEIRFEVTAITPRRWGKTWSVAMFVLALMLAVPGIRICVFSTGKRASTSLMEIICQFMGNVPELEGRKVKENQEELYIADAPLEQGASSTGSAAKAQRQSPHTSKLFCYPCSVTGQFTRIGMRGGAGGSVCEGASERERERERAFFFLYFTAKNAPIVSTTSTINAVTKTTISEISLSLGIKAGTAGMMTIGLGLRGTVTLTLPVSFQYVSEGFQPGIPSRSINTLHEAKIDPSGFCCTII